MGASVRMGQKITSVKFQNTSGFHPPKWDESKMLEACGLNVGNVVSQEELEEAKSAVSRITDLSGLLVDINKDGHVAFTYAGKIPLDKIMIHGNTLVSDEVIATLLPNPRPAYRPSGFLQYLRTAIAGAYQDRGFSKPRIEDRSYIQQGRSDRIQLVIVEDEPSYPLRDNLLDSPVADADNLPSYQSSFWTGDFSVEDRARILREQVPAVMAEIDLLASMITEHRYNDPDSERGLQLLRGLHADLGLLIEALGNDLDPSVFREIVRKNEELINLLRSGAKFYAVAPAMTFGVVYILSALFGVTVDTTLVSTVFGSAVAFPLITKLRNKE
jgi:hypothetical protein